VSPENDLTLVIVSWNCVSLLDSCLRSLLGRPTRASLEVVVVDNASSDGATEMLKARYPAVRVIANSENLGFSRANNLAIRATRSRYVVLLNPDTEIIEPGTLDRLMAFMDDNPEVGAAGAHLVDRNGRSQVGSAGYGPGPATVFAHAFLLARLTRNGIRGLCLAPVSAGDDRRVDVDWVCGACMIIRRTALGDAGLLCERYFLYGEDLEFGHRLRQHGWVVTHLPGVRVMHLLSGTSRGEHNVVSPQWLDGFSQVYMDLNENGSWYFWKICMGTGFLIRMALYGMLALVSRRAAPRRRAQEALVWLRYLVNLDRWDRTPTS